MADVFISYAGEDRDRVGPLAHALEAQGWSVWWDRHIVAGQTFDQVIERELTSAKSIVTLWSTSSVASEWVRNEAGVAAERGVLVPALIDRVALPLEFRRKQTVDLVGWDGSTTHEGFQALCRGIASAHGGVPPPRETTTVHQRPWWRTRGFAAGCVAAAIVVSAVAYWWPGERRQRVPPTATRTNQPAAPASLSPSPTVDTPPPKATDRGSLSATIDADIVRVRWTGTRVWLPEQDSESQNEMRLPISFHSGGQRAIIRRVRVITASDGAKTIWAGAYEADGKPVAEFAPADAEIRRRRTPMRPFELSEQSSLAAKVIDFVAVNPAALGMGTHAMLLQVQSGSSGWTTVERASFTVPADFTLEGRSPSGVQFSRYDRWQVFPLMREP
jgi:TIR domain